MDLIKGIRDYHAGDDGGPCIVLRGIYAAKLMPGSLNTQTIQIML